MEEIIAKILDAPTPSLLIIGGILFLLISLIKLERPIKFVITPQARTIAGIIGGVMLIGGVVLSVTLLSQPSQPDATSVPSPTTPPNTEAPTRLPTSTPVPQMIQTSTALPSFITLTPPIATEKNKILTIKGFATNLWSVSSGKSTPPGDVNGYWQLAPWGWTSLENGLSIFIKDSKISDTYGIYTPVSPFTTITFNFRIDRLISLGNDTGKLSFGIVDANTPGRGSFLVLIETTDTTKGGFQTGNTVSTATSIGKYLYFGKLMEAKFILQGNKLNIYVDGQKLPDMAVSTSNPAFWIGNRFNTGGDVNITISNLEITNN